MKKFFADDMIVNMENPREATDKLLELITESNKFSETKFIKIHHVSVLKLTEN